MAVEKVSQREIVEIYYRTPEGEDKIHPALVLSNEQLLEKEDGMFYAVLISTKNYHPEYTIKIENDWLNRPMAKESYFVTHVVTFFKLKDVIQSRNTFVKSKYFDKVLAKIIDSIFDVQIFFDEDDD
ncbi:type II toxin-antitoxin system PemK/MazF family toxin [Bacteroides sp. An19]|uniref:type II toxin-antitoxin system PemK/MazF family toxin n=1 Tax=Bacteroides sp. An19 TaxID=1965580 RepID=UPI000B3A1A4F|nr:type II toxin-antitoxin system PemK/MazF family toxin [Bacteroides sp. An19]OUP27621.1 hypothetical protein B5F25_18770 [Bacteroides sp. An19]